MQLFEELKRRNVFRVAAAYLVISWLLLQVVDVVGPLLNMSDELGRYLLFLMAIGFIPAMGFAWAFEMTPEGVKRESDVDRSQSLTPETGQKLNRLIIVMLALAVGLLLFDKFMLRDESPGQNNRVASTAQPTSETPAPQPGIGAMVSKSVAVLPFAVMSNGPDDDYFADGLTEEIINSLAQLPDLLVTARTSAFHFKGQNLPIGDIAEQLGVTHVVEGSVRRAGEPSAASYHPGS